MAEISLYEFVKQNPPPYHKPGRFYKRIMSMIMSGKRIKLILVHPRTRVIVRPI